MSKESATGFLERFLIIERAADELAGFLEIAGDGAGAAISVEFLGFQADEDGNFVLVCGAEDTVGEIIGDEALVVVGEDESIEFLECAKEEPQDFLFGGGVQGFTALAVDADDLLMAGDDTGLDGSDAPAVGHDAFVLNRS